MSIIICKHCSKHIDTDHDVEHEEVCSEEKKKPRRSAYGFYCKDCGRFTYSGYDNRDIDFGETTAVCINCSKKYTFK